ncbi:hypothetical protein [Zunongwangia sp. HRR-M8]|uniref:hypothetical protein n=1 Tax=Zunongwangia sp. HRR-M8 TaxID=3015170 RepID=UPI0022DD470C|nr:hypothetical protein [Zunongwangia sp. HRR-M8]WBL20869.1 hypothetical protein PBT89_09015 [Zunongwangia sp. HRR-M8]
MQAIPRMIEEIKFKLDKISDFWTHYLWDYQKCRNEINFDKDDIKTTSFGNLMSYLGDTLEVIENNTETDNFQSAFSYHIGLLQAIYIQQDLILELLRIFGCKISKGQLYEDGDYSINRNLRNELVGHPIRKIRIEHNGKRIEVLKSSVLMDIHSNSNEIAYSRYHIDNNYSFEKLSYKIEDIINRHYSFLKTYIEEVIKKCKKILKRFKKRVENLQKVLKAQAFEDIVKLTAVDFEKIFNSYYIYEPEHLLESFRRRNEHKRYQNNVDQFLTDLNSWLDETLEEFEYAFKKRIFESTMTETKETLFKNFTENDFTLVNKMVQTDVKIKVSYHYELGKLGHKRSYSDFQFFGGLLRDKCKKNKEVLAEINHMEKNLKNDLEYHSSLKLIRKILNEE